MCELTKEIKDGLLGRSFVEVVGAIGYVPGHFVSEVYGYDFSNDDDEEVVEVMDEGDVMLCFDEGRLTHIDCNCNTFQMLRCVQ